MSTPIARSAYLQKYLSGNTGGEDGTMDDSGHRSTAPLDTDYATTTSRKKKKVKSSTNSTTGGGLKIIDEDLNWNTSNISSNAAAAAGIQEVVDEDSTASRKRFQKSHTYTGRADRAAEDDTDMMDVSDTQASAGSTEPTRYLRLDRDDGSGWNTIQQPATTRTSTTASTITTAESSTATTSHHHVRRPRHDSPSPNRSSSGPTIPMDTTSTRQSDSPPPRRRVKRERHDSPDRDVAAPPSPHHQPQSTRTRTRHDSPDPTVDGSRTKRRRHDSSPPPAAESHSPPRRRVRHDSPERDSHSPRPATSRRTRHDSPDAAAASSSATTAAAGDSRAEPSFASSSTKRGLILAAAFKARNAEAAEKARLDLERIAALDGGGSNETVLRDARGRKTTREAVEAERRRVEESKESAPLPWAAGLQQQADAAKQQQALAEAARRPFARTSDDAELNEEQMAQQRWGDPMARQLHQKQQAAAAAERSTQRAEQLKVLSKEYKQIKKLFKKTKMKLKHEMKSRMKALAKQLNSVAATDPSFILPSKLEQETQVFQTLEKEYTDLSNMKAKLREMKERKSAAATTTTDQVPLIIPIPTSSTSGSSAPVVESRPMYTKTTPWPNRFGILPGYRWDGVERGTGWEEKRIRFEIERKNQQTRMYKAGSADM